MKTNKYKFGYADVRSRNDLGSFGFKVLDGDGYYNKKIIREIRDVTAGTAKDIPVAVPSPFAILSLVKTAFDNAYQLITDANQPEYKEKENKDDGVLICYEDIMNIFCTLDLAEFVFKGMVEPVLLKQDIIDTLKSSKDERHKNLGKVLDEYKNLDGDMFGLKGNEDKFKFCLLKYGNDVIGGYSKETLFFPTRDKKLFKNITKIDYHEKISKIIDGTYESIAKFLKENFQARNEEFRKWIISLLHGKENAIGNFLYNIVGNDEWDSHKPSTLSIEENIVEIIQSQIDNLMERKRSIIDRVTIPENYKIELRNKINSMNEEELNSLIKDIEKRGVFADYIVKVPYKVSGHFKILELDGSYYLPPLNDNKNYSCDDIELRYRPENKDEIEIFLKNTPQKKTYGKKGHRGTGLGQIVEGNFNVALFPFVDKAKEYRVQLVERANSEIKSNLKNKEDGGNDFFERRKIDLDRGNDVRTIYVKIENPIMNFQMRYNNDDFNIRLEPSFKSINITQNASFSFAVDFGTTNTHISYRLGDQPPRTFELENYIATLKDMSQDEGLETFHIYLDAEFLPLKIGGNYGFPLRTILSSDEEAACQNRNTKSARIAFKDIGVYNIPFGYGSLEMFGYRYHPNLKWHKENDEYTHFLREVGLLLYAKVLLEGGKDSLSNTKIYFSYPLSLDLRSIEKLEIFWMDIYKDFFLSNTPENVRLELASKAIKKVPESCAPVLYYLKNRQALVNIQDRLVLCVDIGGGTTDCAALIRENDNGKMIDKMVLQSSFKFASNSIFGGTVDMAARESAYNFNYLTEKYVNIYMKDGEGDDAGVLKRIKHGTKDKNTFGNKAAIFKNIVEKNNSGEINSCLFSFDSTTFKEQEDKYVEKLKNDDSYKIAFLYYFSVIIYHLAKLLEKRYNGTKVPPLSEIIFSGNGSKVLDILDFSLANKDVLQKMVQDILSEVKVLNLTKECNEIKLRFDHAKSKVLTAEGSLMPIENLKQCDATEIYGKFINKNNKAETDGFKTLFETFNKIFLKIVEGRLDNFQIKPKYFAKFKETIEKETQNIFTLVNTMAITEQAYYDAMDREEYVEYPMITFEMMLFTLFRDLS